jgi:opacity protein-like surface antigen
MVGSKARPLLKECTDIRGITQNTAYTMKTLTGKISALVVSLALGLALAGSPAQAQIGVAGGYNLDLINNPSFSGSATNSLESTGGFNVGLFYNFPLGDRLSIRPGVFWQQSQFEWQLDGVGFSPLEEDLRVVRIPFDVRYRFPMEGMTPYVTVGPGINFVQTNQHDLRLVLSRQEEGSTTFVGINLGAGVEIPVSSLGLSLQPEVRYGQALSGFVEESYTIRTVEYEADDSVSINNLSFRLGISLLSI